MPDRERESIHAELTPPHVVINPDGQSVPVVLCSPHSGRVYPRAFLAQSRLDPLALRRSEDCYVEELFRDVAGLGAPLIAARFPRAFLDLNREPYELDPKLVSGPLPDYANSQSARVVGGLGTIARIVADGEDIYRAAMPLGRALARIELLYFPFHTELAALLEATKQRFGLAVLIDCHSMPSASTAHGSGRRPDFVLGDRFGTSCDPRLTSFLKSELMGRGYNVQLNRPYAGGYITEHYGRPSRGSYALQIEVNRALYVNEQSLALSRGFATLQRNLTMVFDGFFASLPDLLQGRAAAQ